MNSLNQKYVYWVFSAIAILLAGFLSYKSLNTNYILSDPLGTSITSEQIITNGTIRLDAYGKTLSKYGERVHQKGDHAYYYFPLGTPLLITPIVAAYKAAHVNIQKNEVRIQKAAIAITSAITLFLLIYLAGYFVPKAASPFIGAVFWFGSSLASTTGVALWSHNFAIVFALLGIIYGVKATNSEQNHTWIIIGISIFMAYLCRPTMALYGVFLIGFLFINNRPVAIKSTILLAGLMGLFVGFSEFEFSQPLPDYYLPSRIGGRPGERSLEGVLFSPSRGLFIFMPFLGLALLGLFKKVNSWPLGSSWLLIGLAWPITHMLLISRFQPWTGGWCFGPRLATDMLPGLFLVTLHALPRSIKGVYPKVMWILLAITCVYSIFVNTRQGMFNTWTWAWHQDAPDIWSWSYPQILASKNAYQAKHEKDMVNPS